MENHEVAVPARRRVVFAAAHRGLSAERPENTVAAFQAAAQAGFPAIEMDLRTTADGEVVVLHDPGLERTTHANGRVADMRYDEMRRYDTGAGPVPRLDDLMRALRDWKGLWNLELKVGSAAEATVHLLEHHGLIERAQFTSMDDRALELAREHHPELSRGLITLGPPGAEDVRLAKRLGCTWLNADHEYLDANLVEHIRQEGLHVGAWTVNDPARALLLAGWGIGCIITDTRQVLHALQPKASATPRF